MMGRKAEGVVVRRKIRTGLREMEKRMGNGCSIRQAQAAEASYKRVKKLLAIKGGRLRRGFFS